ncbi:MAG: chemotaxis protein CheD [Chloroflexota bacterium]
MIATASSVIAVGLGDLFVSKSDDLVAYSLGSCVGICLWDPVTKVAAMSHVVLPVAPASGPVTLPGKFGNTAVPALLDAMVRAGAQKSRLRCKIAGGAAVLAIGGGGSLPKIGERNVEAVKAALAKANIRILGEQTGGNMGRTVRLEPSSGRVLVRTVRGAEIEL